MRPLTWRLGTLAGIAVYMHPTFLLLLAFVGWQHWLLGRTVAAVFAGIVFILALFACVVLHELGHALTARRYGIRTRDITLLPKILDAASRFEARPSDDDMQSVVAEWTMAPLFT